MTTTMLDVAAVRSRYSALQRPLAFFDGPGGTQCPDEVIDAIAAYMRRVERERRRAVRDVTADDELVDLAHARPATFSAAATRRSPSARA